MSVYQQINRNKWKTTILIVVFVFFILAIGFPWGSFFGSNTVAFPNFGGLFIALLIASVMSLTSYFVGDKIALFTAGAKPIQKDENPYVWRLVENTAITAGLPMPRVYLINDRTMNAFATGRDPKHASVALTTGIIDGLENEELEGVIAHELSHIKNYDVRLMTVIVVLVGTISLLADWMWRWHFFGVRRGSDNRRSGQIEMIIGALGLALIILSPIIAQLIKFAISRRREFLADASAALLTRYPRGLTGALKKIGSQNGKLLHANHATAHLYISNPFGAHNMKFLGKIFSTHPPLEERIAALEQMAT